MGLQQIEIEQNYETRFPIFRVAGPLQDRELHCLFGYDVGNSADIFQTRDSLNRALQVAAIQFAQKVSNRKIDVEVLIEPGLTPNSFDEAWLAELICILADNASASVEPGPGIVVLKTWEDKSGFGVDAIGVHGMISANIRNNIMMPLFSTRTMDWDTGFGLYRARDLAQMGGGTVQLLDNEDGPCFRLFLPRKRPQNPLGILENQLYPAFLDKPPAGGRKAQTTPGVRTAASISSIATTQQMSMAAPYMMA